MLSIPDIFHHWVRWHVISIRQKLLKRGSKTRVKRSMQWNIRTPLFIGHDSNLVKLGLKRLLQWYQWSPEGRRLQRDNVDLQLQSFTPRATTNCHRLPHSKPQIHVCLIVHRLLPSFRLHRISHSRYIGSSWGFSIVHFSLVDFLGSRSQRHVSGLRWKQSSLWNNWKINKHQKTLTREK